MDLADKSEYYYLKDNAREIRKRMEYEKLDLKYIESQEKKMEDMLNVAEAKTRLIQELSEITGFKYLKSGVLKKTVKDIVFEINFFSSKWNESGQSIEINAELRLIYKTYGKLPVDNVVASMSYQPENGYWYDISTESRLLETRNILEKRFQETAMDLVHRFENNYHSHDIDQR